MKQIEKTELTISKILEAAIEEFGTKGYRGGTINNICKKGINKGLLFIIILKIRMNFIWPV